MPEQYPYPSTEGIASAMRKLIRLCDGQQDPQMLLAVQRVGRRLESMAGAMENLVEVGLTVAMSSAVDAAGEALEVSRPHLVREAVREMFKPLRELAAELKQAGQCDDETR